MHLTSRPRYDITTTAGLEDLFSHNLDAFGHAQ
jgi:hypothetical protein